MVNSMKITIMPNNLKQLQINCDAVIVGVKDLSVGVLELSIEEIKSIKDKEVFVLLNKNMHNNDINILKEALLELNDTNIKGVMFYDVAIVNIKQDLNLKYDLIWAQIHHTTNLQTALFWKQNGCRGIVLSNDITLEEMKKIVDNAKMDTFVTLFGYLPIFTSKRTLITNYLETFDLKEAREYHIHKEGKDYPIIENKGTHVYSPFILDGLEESHILNPDYVIFNGFGVDLDKVIELYKANKFGEIKAMFSNLSKGFLYQETIYQVKK